MYFIFGLGNPEKDYANTRHNMGFNVINKISEKYNIEVNKKKFDAFVGEGVIEGEKVLLIKPQTYMNLSGESVIQFVDFYKLKENNLLEKNLIIIYDDVDIEPGKIRIKKSGSAGTHNGMRSVVNCLKTEKFQRVRIGIGKPHDNIDIMEHVIGAIDEGDKDNLDKGIEIGADAVIEILKNNIEMAMNKYN